MLENKKKRQDPRNAKTGLQKLEKNAVKTRNMYNKQCC